MNITNLESVISYIENTTCNNDLMSIINKIAEQNGFDYYRLALFHPTSIRRPDVTIINSCPSEWIDAYTDKKMYEYDPIIKNAMEKTTPIYWRDIKKKCSSSKSYASFHVMVTAQKFGLVDGVTIPWHNSQGEIGLLSFIKDRELDYKVLLEITSNIFMPSIYLLEKASVLNAKDADRSSLTLRELEVCQWAAEGIPVSEIASILGITSRTVTFHLSQVVLKLGAASKNQAISWVVKKGLVKLNINTAMVSNI
ncbi:MAG: helix-turn-helix transcriptional regulator [Aeromonas hydrophila]